MKNKTIKNRIDSNIDTVDLVFDGNKMTCDWIDTKVAPIVCTLCGKGCDGSPEKPFCVDGNPYCG